MTRLDAAAIKSNWEAAVKSVHEEEVWLQIDGGEEHGNIIRFAALRLDAGRQRVLAERREKLKNILPSKCIFVSIVKTLEKLLNAQ